MNNLRLRFAASALCLFAFCHASAADDSQPHVLFGTSFGRCLGYCFKQIEIVGPNVSYLAKRTEKSDLSVTRETGVLTPSERTALAALLSRTAISDLPSFIGCPDCADGGAAWVEVIRANGGSKRVTFELGHPPGQVAELVSFLQGIKERYNASGPP